MEETQTHSTWQTIRRLLPYLKTHKTWLSLVWFIALINGIMGFIFPYLLKMLTDTALNQQNEVFRQLVLWALAAMLIDIPLSNLHHPRFAQPSDRTYSAAAHFIYRNPPLRRPGLAAEQRHR